jgi:hypothetical protein
MSDLKTGLERIADSGVSGITLLPLREPGAQARVRSRRVMASLAGVCIVVAALAVAVALRSPGSHHSTLRGGSAPVPDASYGVPSAGMNPTLEIGDVVRGAT